MTAVAAPAQPFTRRHERIAIADLVTVGGQRVPAFTAHATHWVPPDPALGRVVIICPALTGSHRVGSDWWSQVMTPGGAIDPQTDTILCVGNLGADDGTDPWQGAAPELAFSVRDQVAIIERVRAALALDAPSLVIGGSLGGMVALELALLHADRAQAVIFGAPAVQTEWARALNAVQREALRLGGPVDGLRLARAVGVLSYRTPAEFEARWGVAGSERAPGRDGPSYLQAHGERLLARFDARLYRRLIDIMDTHDVTRGRDERLDASHITAVALQDDLLYPPADVARWTTERGAAFALIETIHGHDGFLIHEDAVAREVARRHPSPERHA